VTCTDVKSITISTKHMFTNLHRYWLVQPTQTVKEGATLSITTTI